MIDINKKHLKRKILINKIIRNLLFLIFFILLVVLINEIFIQPYLSNKFANEIKDLYNNTDNVIFNDLLLDNYETEVIPEITLPEEKRDKQGRLLQFSGLLQVNEDIKGWIRIPDSNIDYPVLQSSIDNPEYYLKKNFYKGNNRAGSIFLDVKSSIEENTNNLVLHGHNMVSTDNMFHYLIKYNNLDYYKQRPVITFDTLYQKNEWKIIALFKTNGSSKKEPLFDYTKSTFTDKSEYMNFLYQIMIRSIFDYKIDLNEDDQILTLSTCSYEVDNYRTVIVARKVRENESSDVDVNAATIKNNPLYPNSWYKRYGGTGPVYSSTFEEALENGEINWYKSK
ncbi:MAG TPA: class B sortase [Clostridiales bacterium]|nr:class B sortase [Clostridiales bacterium]